MPNIAKFRALSTREQALVALAVLLDGHDAIEFLSSDKLKSTALQRAADDLVKLPPELRLPLLGTLLRHGIAQIESLE